MKILFVDDEPDTRELFETAFSHHGHEVRLAKNGIEACDAVESERFDALVIDGEMPRLTGWDAVHEIRQLQNGKRLPVIIFSAISDDRHRAQEAGADLLLNKPILPKDLLSHIETLARSK